MIDDRNFGPFRIHKIKGEVTLTSERKATSKAQLVAVMADNVGVSFACFFGSNGEGIEALGTAEWFADLANENARLRAAIADLAARKAEGVAVGPPSSEAASTTNSTDVR